MKKTNPTAKNANRAFVRLHTYVTKQQAWEDFASRYRILLESFDSDDSNQHVVQVLDKVGMPAELDSTITHKIIFSTRKTPAMTVWTECFRDGKSSWRNVSCH